MKHRRSEQKERAVMIVTVEGDEDGGIMSQKVTERNNIRDKVSFPSNTVSEGYSTAFGMPFAWIVP